MLAARDDQGVCGKAHDVGWQAASLADGRAVVIRPATSHDLAGIIDLFERLTSAPRYSRFFSPQPRLRRKTIERIVASGPDRFSVLAQPAGFSATTRNVIAVGGWVYLPREARAEISVAVADAWQGVVLGSYLVLVLLRAAVAAGHRRFAAEGLGSNARMLGLLRHLGASSRSHCEAGVVRVEFDLPDATRAPAPRFNAPHDEALSLTRAGDAARQPLQGVPL